MRHKPGDPVKEVAGFNPRICKRCDLKNPDDNYSEAVSIHASVKDATIDENRDVLELEFQSTHL